MRNLVVLATLAVLFCAIQASSSDLGSIEIDGVEIYFGMARLDLLAALPNQFELVDAADIVPAGVQYFEDHGEKAFVARNDQPRSAVAWITFEEGQVTQVSRVIRNLDVGTAHEMTKALVFGIRSAFGEEEMPLIVSSGSHTVSGQTFEFLEARAGTKRVVVRSLPSGTQIVEELGRRDIPVTK